MCTPQYTIGRERLRSPWIQVHPPTSPAGLGSAWSRFVPAASLTARSWRRTVLSSRASNTPRYELTPKRAETGRTSSLPALCSWRERRGSNAKVGYRPLRSPLTFHITVSQCSTSAPSRRPLHRSARWHEHRTWERRTRGVNRTDSEELVRRGSRTTRSLLRPTTSIF